jgi:hypothetical protein
LKKAAEPLIPRENVYRRKQGFSIPIAVWLKTRLRPVVARRHPHAAALEGALQARLHRRVVFDQQQLPLEIEVVLLQSDI